MFSVGQALLAAKPGLLLRVAVYRAVSMTSVRTGVALVGKIAEMYRYYGYTTQVLVRHPSVIRRILFPSA